MKGMLFAAGFFGVTCACGDIVINEIFYNAPDDLRLEFIELYHSGDEVKDISSWSLADKKGKLVTFPDGTMLEGNAFAVVCRSPELFEEFYGFKPLGVMDHGLGNGGDEVILNDADGNLVEKVAYDDQALWPVVADGMSASLERLHPTAPSALPDSWAPSPSSTHYQTIPGGTPGRVNAAYVSSEPPRVLKHDSLPARIDLGAPLGLTLQLDPDGPAASKVAVLYQLATGAGLGEEARLSMDSSGFTYSASIPAQAANGVLRYAYEIVGKDGAIRRFPHEHALRPMFSVFVSNPVAVGSIPSARFILPEGNMERVQRFRYGRREGQAQAFPAQGKAAIVLTDHETKESVLFDYIHIKPRSGGYKVRLHKDRLWRELSTINILKMYAPRHTLCESLAFEFHRRAGVPSSWADYVQLSIDGKAQGIHLAFEQPNKSFLRRHDLDDDGNLYKAIWQGSHQPSPRAYPRGRSSRLIGRHEKKTNVHEDYEDLVELVATLESGEALDPPEAIINYFAANALLSHWDGFHNNYFLYHEVSKKRDQWWMFPWDQDKTWGYHDHIRGLDEVFVDLPLGAGMQGFLPPEVTGPDDQYDGAIGLPGAPWYRYGGEVSRAVLAHPKTRELFLKRVRELATTVFTEEGFGPEIDRLEKRLLPAASPQLQEQIRQTLDAYRKHLKERRRFVLEQPEIQAVR